MRPRNLVRVELAKDKLGSKVDMVMLVGSNQSYNYFLLVQSGDEKSSGTQHLRSKPFCKEMH